MIDAIPYNYEVPNDTFLAEVLHVYEHPLFPKEWAERFYEDDFALTVQNYFIDKGNAFAEQGDEEGLKQLQELMIQLSKIGARYLSLEEQQILNDDIIALLTDDEKISDKESLNDFLSDNTDEKLRKKIKRKGKELKEKGKEWYEEIKQKGKDLIGKGKKTEKFINQHYQECATGAHQMMEVEKLF